MSQFFRTRTVGKRLPGAGGPPRQPNAGILFIRLHIGVGTGGATGAMVPSLFSKNCS